MAYITVPDEPNTATVKLSASTGKGDEKVTDEFEAVLPKDLGSAVKMYSEKDVYRMFINAKVVELQGEKRNDLKPKVAGGERKRASYLEDLGL